MGHRYWITGQDAALSAQSYTMLVLNIFIKGRYTLYEFEMGREL